MDTGVVEKDTKPDYRPGFMQHFDKKDEQKKKVGRKQGPQGPHDISYYFPDIPDGMDFRDFVSDQLKQGHYHIAAVFMSSVLSPNSVKNTDSASAGRIYECTGQTYGPRT